MGWGGGGREIETIVCASLELFFSFGSPAIFYGCNCLCLHPVTRRADEGEGCVYWCVCVFGGVGEERERERERRKAREGESD